MSQKNRLHLIVKFLLGTASPEEQATVEQLLNKDEAIREQIKNFTERKDLVEKYRIYKSLNEQKAYKQFKRRVTPQASNNTWIKPALYAASLAAAVVIGFAAIFIHNNTRTATLKLANIHSGVSSAYLTTNNGTQILLGKNDNDGEHKIEVEGIKANDKNGRLNVEESEEASLQTLTVPRGTEYNLTLPDGTEVHLNAESSITFPTRFSKEARMVALKGEAYFKVQPTADKTPFIVTTNNVVVRQYGTEFNINSYKEEAAIITLIDGSIGVAHKKDLQSDSKANAYTMLTPGYQAVCEQDKAITLKAINTETVAGWHNGLFRFDNAPLKQIVTDLERWYNTEIEVDNHITNLRFTGSISKSESLAHILDAICQSSEITYEATGGVLRIKNRNLISKLLNE